MYFSAHTLLVRRIYIGNIHVDILTFFQRLIGYIDLIVHVLSLHLIIILFTCFEMMTQIVMIIYISNISRNIQSTYGQF